MKGEGVAYCSSDPVLLLINKESVRMSTESNTSNYLTRPYIDIDKTYETNRTVMHYNISTVGLCAAKATVWEYFPCGLLF